MKKTSIRKRLLIFILTILITIPVIHVLVSAAVTCITDMSRNTDNICSEITNGNIAVVQYNSTDGISVYTADSNWNRNEISSGSELYFTHNTTNTSDEYIRINDNNEICMTGTYDNTALVFYVKETQADQHTLSVSFRGIDEVMFFAGIENTVPDIDYTVSYGVFTNSAFEWINLFTHNSASSELTYSVDYKDCFYDADKNAYQIVIRVADGMAAFTNIKLDGLEFVNIKGEKKDLYYKDGILLNSDNSVANAYNHTNFNALTYQMQSDITSDRENQASNSFFSDFFDSIKAFLQKIADFFQKILSKNDTI